MGAREELFVHRAVVALRMLHKNFRHAGGEGRINDDGNLGNVLLVPEEMQIVENLLRSFE